MKPLLGTVTQDGLTEDRLFTAVNCYWPNCVFKRGYATNIKQEADMLQSLSHPSIVCAVGILETTETINDVPAAYMALQRLGPSLETMQG